MREVVLDTETTLIVPGCIFTDLVCVSAAERIDGVIHTGLFDREAGADLIASLILDDSVILVGHNLPFDLGVVVKQRPALLEPVYAKYEKGLFRDTITQQQMLDIASGEMKFHVDEDDEPKRTSYSLAALSWRLLRKFLKKEDTWRLRYGELMHVPVASWPEDAKKYAIDDSVTTLEVYEKQMEIAFG